MSVPTIISVICFSLVIINGLLFASLYLFRSKYMPYHADAVGKSWHELDSEIRILIIALMRVVGGGWMASSIAIGGFMYLFIFSGVLWASLAMVITGMAVCIPTLLATLIVKRRTKASPPIFAVLLSIVLLLTGFVVALMAG